MPHTAMIRALEASGDFKVLRKLTRASVDLSPAEGETRRGIFLDLETTGLDPARDEIIELAMVPFRFSPEGLITEIQETVHCFNEPSRPIGEKITRLTGITDEMVRGHRIDPAEIAARTADAELVIAHNAGFDRKFAERLTTEFATKPWACSWRQVDWERAGFEGAKLSHLVLQAGFFFDGHRAENDCLAALMLLSKKRAETGTTALAGLLARYQIPSWRIWAENAPYDLRHKLKARGYRWNPEGPNPRGWHTDVFSDEARDLELKFLREEIYRREISPQLRKITALERYSTRE